MFFDVLFVIALFAIVISGFSVWLSLKHYELKARSFHQDAISGARKNRKLESVSQQESATCNYCGLLVQRYYIKKDVNRIMCANCEAKNG